ncbi:hypothetical protein GCM10010451_08380 [Streptomyces virens]|uniref:Secreted protein n=1 Tax=Streptomyces virens TaxID=285572 RepID=A0ABP6P1K8_9ACTN
MAGAFFAGAFLAAAFFAGAFAEAAAFFAGGFLAAEGREAMDVRLPVETAGDTRDRCFTRSCRSDNGAKLTQGATVKGS